MELNASAVNVLAAPRELLSLCRPADCMNSQAVPTTAGRHPSISTPSTTTPCFKKNSQNCFCHNCVKFLPILIIFLHEDGQDDRIMSD